MIAERIKIPFSVAAACFVAAILSHCAAAPTPAQQAGVGIYSAALQACIAQAKLQDSGIAGYQACAGKVDEVFGPDGGVR